MQESLNETNEFKFWLNLLAYLPDSLTHQVRHYLTEHLEREWEFEVF